MVGFGGWGVIITEKLVSSDFVLRFHPDTTLSTDYFHEILHQR